MTLFIQDSPWDYLMYYPLIRELERKKQDWKLLDVTGKSISDLIVGLSAGDIESVVIWGESEMKLMAMLMLKDMGIKTFLLDGNRRLLCYDQDHLKSSILHGMSSLAWLNLVSSDSAKGFLIDEGVKTQITLIESPITNLACKLVGKNNVQNNDEILVCVSDSLTKSVISGVKQTGKKWVSLSPTDAISEPETFYKTVARVGMIVSDCFVFDTVGKEMGKHFFYIGDEITGLENLGVSTHTVFGNKKELQDYLKQSWSPLPIRRPDYGLQSLLKYL